MNVFELEYLFHNGEGRGGGGIFDCNRRDAESLCARVVLMHGGRAVLMHGGRAVLMHGGRAVLMHGGRAVLMHGGREQFCSCERFVRFLRDIV